jgi:NDP-sugar pyrophosphorylase family protein
VTLLPVVILAGGLASRLRPLTDDLPKSLVPINGEPFLAHQLRLLEAVGVKRIVLCTGYLGDKIRAWLGNGSRFGMQVEYARDWPVLRGTAGAVRKALHLAGSRFFVLYGDSYLTCDYKAVQRAFEESDKPALMTVYPNDGQGDASNVEFAGGRIICYDKRNRTPSMRHIDYGLGVFEATAFDDPAADLAVLYQHLLERGELAAYEVHERFYEIGSFGGIEELSDHLKRQ